MSRDTGAYTPSPGDRVRLGGFDGPRAVIVMFRRHADGVPFFKARVLGTGALEWPTRVVADSEGAFVRACTDCELSFRTDRALDMLCPNCARPDRGPQDPGTRARTGARWWRGR